MQREVYPPQRTTDRPRLPKGVWRDGPKFRAVLQVNRWQVYLGRFATVEAAAADWARAKQILDQHRAEGRPLPLWALLLKPAVTTTRLNAVPDLLASSEEEIRAERERNRLSKQAGRCRAWIIQNPERARAIFNAIAAGQEEIAA